MTREINNPSGKTIYFDQYSNELLPDIYNQINIKKLRIANLSAHEKNITQYALRPDQYTPVINGIWPIPPRSRWVFDGSHFRQNNNSFIESKRESNISDLLLHISRLLLACKKDKIAVELSGGLDTAIIIGILKYFKSDLLLIGIKSTRFEFRTESYIQDLLRNNTSKTIFLTQEESLPYSNLQNTPSHQLPSATSVFYSHAQNMANICKENGVQLLLTGMGLDTLLCEEPKRDEEVSLPSNWFTWALSDNWFNENIYNKFGLFEMPAAARQIIIKDICSMRKNEKEDVQKWWARRTFSGFIPNELVNYSYKADHTGNYIDGLIMAKNEIIRICKIVNAVLRTEDFNDKYIERLLHDIPQHDNKLSKKILARVSFANWIYGLHRDECIR